MEKTVVVFFKTGEFRSIFINNGYFCINNYGTLSECMPRCVNFFPVFDNAGFGHIYQNKKLKKKLLLDVVEPKVKKTPKNITHSGG